MANQDLLKRLILGISCLILSTHIFASKEGGEWQKHCVAATMDYLSEVKGWPEATVKFENLTQDFSDVFFDADITLFDGFQACIKFRYNTETRELLEDPGSWS